MKRLITLLLSLTLVLGLLSVPAGAATAQEAQEAAEKQIAERDFNDALKAAMEGLEFTSAAAKRAFEADVRANCSKVKDGTIIGFSDVLASAKKEDASAFVDKKNPPAQFTFVSLVVQYHHLIGITTKG
jgi:hypothetical protein